MRIRLSCPACGTAFAVADRHAGKVGRCPAEGCGAKVRVPAAGAAKPAAPPAPRTRRTKKKTSLPVGPIAAGLAAVVAVAAGLFALLPGGATVRVAAGPSPALVTDAAAPPAPPATPIKTAAADRPPLVLTSLVKPETAFEERLGPFLKTYCVDCHGPDYAEADIDFEAFASADDLRADREKWDRVLAIVRVGAMPPSEMDQPTPEERAAAVEWIDRALHEVNCEVVNDPGRVTVRRLNRQEYDNTVRDLLGVNLTLADDFPSDDVGNGFDNQGDVLTLPPLLLEKYLDAAETIASEAVVGDISTLLTQTKDFSSEGSVDDETRTFKFPESGDYTIRVIARAQQGGNDKAKYGVTLAGLPLAQVTIREDGTPETFERTVPVRKGDYPIRVKFLNDFYKPDAPGGKIDRNLYLNAIEVVGPLGTRPTNLPEVHANIVVATPEDSGGVKDAAEAVFRPLATRAFRRPATDLEVSRLAGLVESVVSGGRSYEEGIQVGLQAVLCSPHFLFRIERDPDDAPPRRAGRAERLRTGQPAELLPLEFDAGRRTDAAGRRGAVVGRRRARRPGRPDAGRPEGGRAGGRVLRPVAEPADAVRVQPGRAEVRAVLERHAEGVDAAGDGTAVPRDRGGGPAGLHVPDGRLHLREPAVGGVLRRPPGTARPATRWKSSTPAACRAT